MKLIKHCYCLLILLTINSYSQNLFKAFGEREYTDALDIELLRQASKSIGIDFSKIYLEKSNSKAIQGDKTFFAIQYVTKHTTDGDMYTTKYIYVDNQNKQVLDHRDEKEMYYAEEAIQLSPSYVLKNDIKLNSNTLGIGVFVETSAGGCASQYTQQYFSIITLIGDKISVVLDKYTVRKTVGESNCAGTYEIETLEKSISLEENSTNGFLDLLVTKNFEYEKVTEVKPKENVKEEKILKHKTKTELLTFNDQEYGFKDEEEFVFIKW